jgi:hypothetical protein
MKVYYFCNPTADRHAAKEVWMKLRDELKGIAYIANPFYYQNGNPKPEIRALDGGGKPRITNNDIEEMDLELINMATEGIIAYLSPQTSHGSSMELWVCDKDLKRPVYALGKTTPGDRDEHPWIDNRIHKHFENPYALIKFLKEEE